MKPIDAKLLGRAPAAMLFLILSIQSGAGATLTGATLFDTNAAGNAGSQLWNTRGGDAFPNLYLLQPPLNTFYNSGNGASASINVPVTIAVNYVFVYWAQPGSGSNFGLNLFFDGASTPGISAMVPVNSIAFTANSAANTKRLDGTNVAGAGTTLFIAADAAIRLVAFTNFASLTDTVQAFDNTAGAGPDFTGFITLTVNAVPEPGALGFLAIGSAMLAALGILKRRKISARPRAGDHSARYLPRL